MLKAASAIVPPSSVPLEKCDPPFFASVIAEFARSEWTAHQLGLEAMLARTMADLNREQRLLRVEGSVVTTERGTPVANSRKAVVQMHAASILSFRRSLSLHARARKGARRATSRRHVVARRQLRQTTHLMMICWRGQINETTAQVRMDFDQEASDSIIVGAHEHEGYLWHTKFIYRTLSLDDPKPIGISTTSPN
jgi:hypothetical protein